MGDRGGKANGKSRRGQQGGRDNGEWRGHSSTGAGWRKPWPKERESHGRGNNGWNSAMEGAWQPWTLGTEAAASVRPSSALLRFSARVLRRHAPEERVYSPDQQLRPGDHVIVQQTWSCSEKHGIVSNSRDRSDRRSASEPPWVIYWNGSNLHSTPLPKFVQGGDLYRVVYPNWACRCAVPVSTTITPEVLAEDWLEAAPPEVTVRIASEAQRSGAWQPSWAAQSADLEFCLFAKLGGRSPTWEIHSRRAYSSKSGGIAPGEPVGCLLRGKLRPAETLSGLATPTAGVRTNPPPPAPAPRPTTLPLQTVVSQNVPQQPMQNMAPMQQMQQPRPQQPQQRLATGPGYVMQFPQGGVDWQQAAQQPQQQQASFYPWPPQGMPMSATAEAFVPSSMNMPWAPSQGMQAAPSPQAAEDPGTVYQ